MVGPMLAQRLFHVAFHPPVHARPPALALPTRVLVSDRLLTRQHARALLRSSHTQAHPISNPTWHVSGRPSWPSEATAANAAVNDAAIGSGGGRARLAGGAGGGGGVLGGAAGHPSLPLRPVRPTTYRNACR